MVESSPGLRPTIQCDHAPDLSIVVPAYNEAGRIERCLSEVIDFTASRTGSTEVLLVDDGSTDTTLAIARQFAERHPALRVIACPHRGKAATVREGFLAARGRIVMFTDADLATPLHYVDALLERLTDRVDVAIASREGKGAVRVDEPIHRHLMGRVFNGIVQLLLLPGIDDTQCGFKAFRQEAAVEILGASLLYRSEAIDAQPRVTAFDVELLYIARRLGMEIAVLPVVWSAGSGSKVNPIRDTWINLRDVLSIRLNAWRGRYPQRTAS